MMVLGVPPDSGFSNKKIPNTKKTTMTKIQNPKPLVGF
jgi:hypothetical protein